MAQEYTYPKVSQDSEADGRTHTHRQTMPKLLHPLLTRGVIIIIESSDESIHYVYTSLWTVGYVELH